MAKETKRRRRQPGRRSSTPSPASTNRGDKASKPPHRVADKPQKNQQDGETSSAQTPKKASGVRKHKSMLIISMAAMTIWFVFLLYVALFRA